MPVDPRQEAIANLRGTTRTILDALDRAVRDRRRCQILSLGAPFTDDELAKIAPGLTVKMYEDTLTAYSALNAVLSDPTGNPTTALVALEAFSTGPGRI